MQDLLRALDGLDEDLARVQRELSILERIELELSSMIDRGDEGTEPLIRRHFEEMQRRSAEQTTETLVVRLMDKSGFALQRERLAG